MSNRTTKKTTSRILLSILITLVFAVVYFYITLPAINLHNPGIYSFVCICLLLYIVIAMILMGFDTGTSSITFRDYVAFAKSQCKLLVVILLAIAALYIIGQIISMPIFRSSAYHNLLEVNTGNFATDVEQVSYNEIPMLDESSARRLGDRKLGELADMVSQFEVSDDYIQINYQNRPVRVSSLEYGDFFKWFNNRVAGLPAYVLVDMVSQEVQVIRMSNLNLEGIHFSPSEYFNHDLNRALRFQYPTFMFRSAHLEIDDNGQPFWVCPRETRTIGLFGGADIIGAVLMNASTGECTYYDISDIPTWVDRVYTAGLITQQYNYFGTYVNGFMNSIIGQRDVTVTTDGYNYVVMGDDVYMYTGITSVSSDQSNIGFLLSNQRTKDTTFYSAPGAIERSAQGSAEGVVQDLGYKSTFPLLLNIAGQPTYFMSLKDSSDLVKMYAMVNVGQYQLVATGTTVAQCESNYVALLTQAGIDTSEAKSQLPPASQVEATGIIAEIRTAVLDGNSYYFLRLQDTNLFYSISASSNPEVVILNRGDNVTIQASKSETGSSILNAHTITLNAAANS
jgi:hypothetical protein